MENLFLLWRLPMLWIAALGMSVPAVAAERGADAPDRVAPDRMAPDALGKMLQVGDVVFIRVPVLPFEKISGTTNSWTNHVGIVTEAGGAEPRIAESRFPRSGTTTWSRFVARSKGGRVAVGRLGQALDQAQGDALRRAAAARSGVFYDTGFDLHSRRQFCSRYVREVLGEATGIRVGEVETFSTLLARNPQADLAFWRIWYFGYIPWQRETVTPASLLRDARLTTIFDGYASVAGSQRGN